MPIGGAPPPGAATSGTAVKHPKPGAFAAFEDYVNADAKHLNDLIDGIGSNGGNKGSDRAFWDNSPISKKDTNHFLGDWIGGGYWPSDQGGALYKVLRKGVREGALAAKSGNKPLHMDLWVDSSAASVTVSVDDAGTEVMINITTPPI